MRDAQAAGPRLPSGPPRPPAPPACRASPPRVDPPRVGSWEPLCNSTCGHKTNPVQDDTHSLLNTHKNIHTHTQPARTRRLGLHRKSNETPFVCSLEASSLQPCTMARWGLRHLLLLTGAAVSCAQVSMVCSSVWPRDENSPRLQSTNRGGARALLTFMPQRGTHGCVRGGDAAPRTHTVCVRVRVSTRLLAAEFRTKAPFVSAERTDSGFATFWGATNATTIEPRDA